MPAWIGCTAEVSEHLGCLRARGCLKWLVMVHWWQARRFRGPTWTLCLAWLYSGQRRHQACKQRQLTRFHARPCCILSADTEEYLHRLAGKIASVKMSAEASQAAARAITEARAKVR